MGLRMANFPFTKHGGDKGALSAAILHRDTTISTLLKSIDKY